MCLNRRMFHFCFVGNIYGQRSGDFPLKKKKECCDLVHDQEYNQGPKHSREGSFAAVISNMLKANVHKCPPRP